MGFIILTPICDSLGWRALFFICGGIGLFIMVPLYIVMLKKESEAPYAMPKQGPTEKLTLKALGGAPFKFFAIINLAFAKKYLPKCYNHTIMRFLQVYKRNL